MIKNLKAEIREMLTQAAADLWPGVEDLHFVLEEPNVASHGHLSSNLALVLAKRQGQKPQEVGRRIAEKLLAADAGQKLFSRIESHPSGFINFFLSPENLLASMPGYFASLSRRAKRGEKIVLEHTNVNPNKAMHIGHLRNAILGDVINRLLQTAGYDTEVQYYVDDTGVQVADTYVGLQQLKLKPKAGEKFDHFCWRVYADVTSAMEMAEDEKLKASRQRVLQAVEQEQEPESHEVKELARRIVVEHLATLAPFGVHYDLLVWESDVLRSGFWHQAFSQLQRSPLFVKETSGKNAGCWVLKPGGKETDEEHSQDKVIVKSDGTVTYTGKDIAYHLWKYDLLGQDFVYRPWSAEASSVKDLWTTDMKGKKVKRFGRANRVYNVIDVRQSYPQQMVKMALNTLGFDQQAEQLRHVAYGVVTISAATAKALKLEVSGDSLSMSGRKGIGVKIDDFVAAVIAKVESDTGHRQSERAGEKISASSVAIAVIKYFMLRYNPQTEIVFDYEQAAALQGNTGPYIQYAFARAGGILAKANFKKSGKLKAVQCSEVEIRLLAKIYFWPDIIRQTAEDLNVNRLCEYAFSLADLFSSFYEAYPVVTAEGEAREQRLVLVWGVKNILGSVLDILGIAAPDKM